MIIHCFFSNAERSGSPTVEVSESENLKSEKFYLTSTLSDGVLQQVEVTKEAILKFFVLKKYIYSLSLTVPIFHQLSSETPASPSTVGSPSLNTKRFSCRICMESFHGRSDMENHKRAHLDANTFKCPDCDFTSASWPEVKVSFKFKKRNTVNSLIYLIAN